MSSNPAIVITSIADGSSPILKALAEGSNAHGMRMIVIGDAPNSDRFALTGCEFFGLKTQQDQKFSYTHLCPVRSYARKNIGYLIAAHGGAPVTIETDDDNWPADGFWDVRGLNRETQRVDRPGWTNVYRLFADTLIWPRGLPLASVRDYDDRSDLADNCSDYPIQQGLVDDDPDVDAIYRMLFPAPVRFAQRPAVSLAPGAWCPFNSQNTSWWRCAFPLMYLPAFVPMRLTDIWRSFVAQRVAWTCGWSLCFHAPTMYQDRNAHNLDADFAEEVGGYLHNDAIRQTLDDLALEDGAENIGANVVRCYEAMVARRWIQASELDLLAAWLADMADCLMAGDNH